MVFKSPVFRLSIALALLTVNLLLLASLVGLVPDQSKYALELRKRFCEAVALQFSSAAEKGDLITIQHTLRAMVDRNEDLRSAAIRTTDGNLVALAGEHLAHWKKPPGGKSTAVFLHVPVFRKNEEWASVEMRFAPLWGDSLIGSLSNSFLGLLWFILLGGFICNYLIIRRALRELDPSSVIPERVRRAFDILQEGVLILDEKEQIVLANKSFAEFVGKPAEEMIALKGSELGWVPVKGPSQNLTLPWLAAQKNLSEETGALLALKNIFGKTIKFSVNATIVADYGGKCRGTLATFDDVTMIEEKNLELKGLVDNLQLAKEEIHGKNKELEFIASHDPLTMCYNRRSLARSFEKLFTQAKASGGNLSCIMVDIDFFKSVNDRYGHAVGDQVIKEVADVLKTSCRENDLVGRYGGEEFCLVLPTLSLKGGVKVGERIRQTIEKGVCSGIKVTTSLGVAAMESNANTMDELINLADKALYIAKKSGRNRVVAWAPDGEGITEFKNHQQPTTPGVDQPPESDQSQLQHRIIELEGLLEKRTLEIKHFEMYDQHTGLPTRSLFEDRIANEIARGRRTKYLVVVLSIILDKIKRIHETFGKRIAVQLLKACGDRMKDVIRENIDTAALMDNLKHVSTVSMINETEFGILLTDIQQTDHVTWVLKRLTNAFVKPFKIQEHEIYISPHFGVAIFPHDGETVEELCSSASNACNYAQKRNGKDCYLFASKDLNEKAAYQLRIENALHEALDNDELQLHFQPKMDSSTGQIAGFEALLRWQSKSLGSVLPGEFIPIAEQTGLIAGIGDWVLYTTCRQLRTWIDSGFKVVPIAVNLSGVQLRQENLFNRISQILREFNLDPQLLEIELTESSLITIGSQNYAILEKLKEMGIRVAVDDFGTGYSSLSYLSKIPLSCVKIDRSFIADMNKNKNCRKLISSIISMAHKLGLEVVGEGVEEKQQVDQLIAFGCDYLQGYYFSRPVSQDKAERMLEKQPLAMVG